MDDTTRRMPAPDPLTPARGLGLTAHGVSDCGPVRTSNDLMLQQGESLNYVQRQLGH